MISLSESMTDYVPSGSMIGVNLKQYFLQISDQYIEITSKICKQKLVLDRKNLQIEETKYNTEISNIKYKGTFSVVLGILQISEINFLLTADENHEFYQIKKVQYFAIENVLLFHFTKFFYQKKVIPQETEKKAQTIQRLLQKYHYFSSTYDLTLSLQQQETSSQFYDKQYFWTYSMLTNFMNQVVISPYGINFFNFSSFFFQMKNLANFSIQKQSGKTLEYLQISRRSSLRGGTRFKHRGGDTNGNVANFVETETIVKYNDKIASHVQVRGSIPLFWEQNNMGSYLQVCAIDKVQQDTFMKHLQFLHKQYQNIVSMNLLSNSKQAEIDLTTKYKEKIQQNQHQIQFFEHKTVDYHEICKDNNFEAINSYIFQIHQKIENFQFFQKDLISNKIENQQYGVIRTNCLDCMDRTNVFMSKIAAMVLCYMMQSLQYEDKVFFDVNLILTRMHVSNRIEEILCRLKYLWADQGDNISQIYAGTSASTTTITKTGSAGVFGMLWESTLKGVDRLYQSTFEDDLKHECLQLISGKGGYQNTNDILEQFFKMQNVDQGEFESINDEVLDDLQFSMISKPNKQKEDCKKEIEDQREHRKSSDISDYEVII